MVESECSFFHEVVNSVAAEILAVYKEDEDKVIDIITTELISNPRVLTLIQTSANYKAVSRTALFKSFKKDIKKKIYFGLRRYSPGLSLVELAQNLLNANPKDQPEALLSLLSSHVSTKERLPEIDGYYDFLLPLLPSPLSILDIGCGINPLAFPMEKLGVSSYVALDKDSAAIEAVNICSKALGLTVLQTNRADFSEGWERLLEFCPTKSFSLGLLQKVVPAVQRQNAALLPMLASAPVDYLLISGSEQSMTKNKSIRRREAAVLIDFISKHNFTVVVPFNKKNEFGWLVKRQPIWR